MKLFKTRIEFDMVVYAKDEVDAREIIEDNATEELANAMSVSSRKTWVVSEIEDKRDLPEQWGNAIPWGRYDDLTCRELLDGDTEVCEK